ncbi:MAG TPA: DUF4381 domain-containing protein [Steroidobacteraceae bacterium]|nr:DUF4381 domain-containing protein [Steroidobacteraceae bacterium]
MSSAWTAQLAPDHAPAAVSWWPPAPGWWAVLVLAAALTPVLWAALRWWRDPRRRYRRAALRELELIRARPADTSTIATALETLLRRYAMALYGAERVARLTGSAWLGFLGREGGERLAGETGHSLLVAAFGARGPDQRQHWLAAAEEFIRSARVRRAARPP